ncbi:hypothetical protein [Celeribacter halophilus]|uniref:hypothetical protein n=1 Tax=Celeribacter halophilus TaxID=576117 RepID=UPI003A8E0608
MNEVSIGAVGAAIIAGLISILGLIIGKEQKVSEFRQAWINDLRNCVRDYLVNINAISDLIRLRQAGEPIDNQALVGLYRNLNEASHGITLRINEDEAPAKAVLGAMKKFECLAQKSETLTPERISEAEKEFIQASKQLLKSEWSRVKAGEKIFVTTKRLVFIITALLIALVIYQLIFGHAAPENVQDFRIFPA